MKPLRQGAGLQADPGQRQAELPEEGDQRLRLARHLGFADDPARPVDHAHAAPFQRDVDPGIVLHGCPSMMPGADPFGPRSRHHSGGQPPRRVSPAQRPLRHLGSSDRVGHSEAGIPGARGGCEWLRGVRKRRWCGPRCYEFFASQQPDVVALEACGGAHHWAREIGRLGHTVQLIPPAYVKKPSVERRRATWPMPRRSARRRNGRACVLCREGRGAAGERRGVPRPRSPGAAADAVINALRGTWRSTATSFRKVPRTSTAWSPSSRIRMPPCRRARARSCRCWSGPSDPV